MIPRYVPDCSVLPSTTGRPEYAPVLPPSSCETPTRRREIHLASVCLTDLSVCLPRFPPALIAALGRIGLNLQSRDLMPHAMNEGLIRPVGGGDHDPAEPGVGWW